MAKEFYSRKHVRSPERTEGEHLNSPVNDPGYWPYLQLSEGLQSDAVGLKEPRNPVGYVPPYRRGKDGLEPFEK